MNTMSWRENSSNILSFISLYWTRYLLKTHKISESNIDNLDENEKSKILLKLFKKYWNNNDNNISLIRITINVLGIKKIIIILSIYCMINMFKSFIWIVLYHIFTEMTQSNGHSYKSEITYYVKILFVFIGCRSMILPLMEHLLRKFKLQIQQLYMVVLLDKCLTINSNNIETGYIINMLNKDIHAIMQLFIWCFKFLGVILSFGVFIIIITLMTRNYWILISIPVILVVFVISAFMGTRLGAILKDAIQYTDESLVDIRKDKVK